MPNNQVTLLTDRTLSADPEWLACKCSSGGEGRCGDWRGRLSPSCLECEQPDLECELAAGCKAESWTRAAPSICGTKHPQPNITGHVATQWQNHQATNHTWQLQTPSNKSYLATADIATGFQLGMHEPRSSLAPCADLRPETLIYKASKLVRPR